MMEWLCQHTPLPEIKEIMSISTGVIEEEKINCHMSQKDGSDGIIVSDFCTVKFNRDDRIKPLGVMNAGIRIDNDIVPLLIFQRICIAKESYKELENFLSFELAPFPLSLFNKEGMRKCVKSSLYKAFQQYTGSIDFGNTIYVIDRGYLLHRVVLINLQQLRYIRSIQLFIECHNCI